MERHTSYEVQVTQPDMNSVSLTVLLPPEREEAPPVHSLRIDPPTFQMSMCSPEAPPVPSLRIDPPTFQMSMCSPHQVPMVDFDDIPPPKADFSAPPPYDLATKLPTYEEVQREKTLQGELPLPRASAPHRPQTLAFLAIDTDAVESDAENSLLGTDFMFSLAFFVAFLFNWIGFLLLMCFCHTVAARYGALSGFGLSLAKWTLIVKQSTDLASHENSWLWWLVMAFGLLICVRAIIQYLNIKRGWRLLSGSAQERLLFFY